MPDITHILPMNAPRAQVYRALVDHWRLGETARTQYADSPIALVFGDARVIVKANITELEKETRVTWQCVDGPKEWIGTEITFDLAPCGDRTMVRFQHRHWQVANEFMGRCSTDWAAFLFSIKSMIETPEPDDLV